MPLIGRLVQGLFSMSMCNRVVETLRPHIVYFVSKS
jgi:hypothetical protein